MKRLTVLILVAFVAASCGFDEPAHSDYFVVTFLPDMPALTQEGNRALHNAVNEAGRHRPNFIAVSGASPGPGPTPALTQQRLDAITKAFVGDGVNAALMRIELAQYGATAYAERKDGFIIRLAYGTMP
ncbi:MAG TPA: hypothetical protein VMU87_12730 [Stellaceae bacterium]|nr:hypothetical protein [Stellaceae bacterium]